MAAQGVLDPLNVVVSGQNGVGKTTLVNMFVKGLYMDCGDPTIEDDFLKQIDIEGNSVFLRIYDTVESEDQEMTRPTYINQASVFVFVFSLTDASSLAVVESHIDRVVKDKGVDATELCMYIVGSKADLEGDREVEAADAQKLAGDKGCEYVELCAKTDTEGCKEFFTKLARNAIERGVYTPPVEDKSKQCLTM